LDMKFSDIKQILWLARNVVEVAKYRKD
jgi:hypothetical protein